MSFKYGLFARKKAEKIGFLTLIVIKFESGMLRLML